MPSRSNSMTACALLIAWICPRRSISSRSAIIVVCATAPLVLVPVRGLFTRGRRGTSRVAVAVCLDMVTASFFDDCRALDIECQQQVVFQLVDARDQVARGAGHGRRCRL